MSTQLFNDWRPETLSLLNLLLNKGFSLVSGNNGDDDFSATDFASLEAFADELAACDEATLKVRFPMGDARTVTLRLVYGNSPGELVADYYAIDNATLAAFDPIADAHNVAWDGKTQPTLTRAQYDARNGR